MGVTGPLIAGSSRAGRAALGGVIIGMLLAGCAAAPSGGAEPGQANVGSTVPLSQLHALSDPKTYLGPSTAVIRSTGIAPIQKSPEQKLPATVASHDRGGDIPVTVKSTARIVAFDVAGSIAGTIYGLGLGDHLVGRDVATTLPGTEELPVVTSRSGQSIDTEAVLALAPTLVITDGTVGPLDVVQQLRDSRIPVVFVNNELSFEGAAELARQVGAALGVPEVGSLLAKRITTDVEKKIAEIARIAPADPDKKLRMVFLYLRGASGIYYLFGGGSGAEKLIGALGGIDVAQEIKWTGMKPMTDEAMIAANPDLVLVMTDGLRSTGGVEGLIAAKPAIGLTNAGKNKRFVDMADGQVLSFGPRSADILDALARAAYAPNGK